MKDSAGGIPDSSMSSIKRRVSLVASFGLGGTSGVGGGGSCSPSAEQRPSPSGSSISHLGHGTVGRRERFQEKTFS